MHPDLQAIVDADRIARQDVEAARQRLAAQEDTERDRLEAERVRAAAARQAELDAAVAKIASDSGARVIARRAERAAERRRRASDAERVAADAIAAYAAIVRGDPSRGDEPT